MQVIIDELERSVREVPIGKVPILIGVLSTIMAQAQARLMLQKDSEPTRQEDRLLTVAEASEKLSMTPDYLYRHADTLPFTVRIGAKQLRFSLKGIERYIAKRQACQSYRIDINT